MEKSIDYNLLDITSSIHALASYTKIKDQQIVLSGNAIRIVPVNGDLYIRPESELLAALFLVVQEANKRIQDGTLSESTHICLKLGLWRLRERELASLLKSPSLLGSKQPTTVQKVMNIVSNGLRALSFDRGKDTFREVSSPFPLLDLLSELRRFHVFKHLTGGELLTLTRTKKILDQEIKATLDCSNRILIAQVIKFVNNSELSHDIVSQDIMSQDIMSQALFLTADLQEAMKDLEGAEVTRKLSCNLLDFGYPLVVRFNILPEELPRLAAKKAKGKDLSGAIAILDKAISLVNVLTSNRYTALIAYVEALSDSHSNQFIDLIALVEAHIALEDIEGAKTLLSKAKKVLEIENAKTYLSKAKELLPKVFHFAELQVAVKDFDGAKETLQQLIKKHLFDSSVGKKYNVDYDHIGTICEAFIKCDRLDLAINFVRLFLGKNSNLQLLTLIALASTQSTKIKSLKVEEVEKKLSGVVKRALIQEKEKVKTEILELLNGKPAVHLLNNWVTFPKLLAFINIANRQVEIDDIDEALHTFREINEYDISFNEVGHPIYAEDIKDYLKRFDFYTAFVVSNPIYAEDIKDYLKTFDFYTAQLLDILRNIIKKLLKRGDIAKAKEVLNQIQGIPMIGTQVKGTQVKATRFLSLLEIAIAETKLQAGLRPE